MTSINSKISYWVFRVLFGTAMASVFLVGAALAQTSRENEKKAKENLAHYTKVAGKDTGQATGRAAKATAHVTKRASVDTGRAVDKTSGKTAKTVKRGSGDTVHGAKVAGKKTGRFFRRVGRAIY